MQYLFIDGGHLRVAYQEIVPSYFGDPGEIDYAALLRATESEKAFLYDCIDDVRRDDESEPQWSERVARQEKAFDRIQALPYYHVRLGQLSGTGKKKRQKKVDILLSVDMLSFAHNRVIGGAALIAGDLDFAPIVDALVRGGTRVHVFYNPRGAARELYTAADVSHQMNILFMHEISSERFKRTHPLPSEVFTGPNTIPGGAERYGQMDGKRVAVQLASEGRSEFYYLHIDEFRPGQTLRLSHNDRTQLELYAEQVYGPIQWE